MNKKSPYYLWSFDMLVKDCRLRGIPESYWKSFKYGDKSKLADLLERHDNGELLKSEIEQLASSILDAVKIREDSYDKTAADEQEKINDLERKNNPDNQYAGLGTDWAQFYRKTMDESIKESIEKNGVDKRYHRVIDLLLFTCWDDIIFWSQEILGIEIK